MFRDALCERYTPPRPPSECISGQVLAFEARLAQLVDEYLRRPEWAAFAAVPFATVRDADQVVAALQRLGCIPPSPLISLPKYSVGSAVHGRLFTSLAQSAAVGSGRSRWLVGLGRSPASARRTLCEPPGVLDLFSFFSVPRVAQAIILEPGSRLLSPENGTSEHHPNPSKRPIFSVQALSKPCPSLSKHPIFLSKHAPGGCVRLRNHSVSASKFSAQLT